MSLTGECSTSANSLEPQQLISERLVGELLGDGAYVALPGIVVDKAGQVPAAYNGSCSIAPTDDENDVRLKIALLPHSDPGYAVAQHALATGAGVDVVDDHTYVTDDPTTDAQGNRIAGAKGVAVLPDRVVIVEVLKPGDGVDAMKQAGPAVSAVVDNLRHLG